MDSSGEKLHPNWRALATLNLRLKRFVAEGTVSSDKSSHELQRKYCIKDIRGDEASNFYKEVVSSNSSESMNGQSTSAQNKTHASTSNHKTSSTLNNNNKRAIFDCKKYFRFAVENNCKELEKIDLKTHDINARDSFGWTALMMAACEGAADAVKFLLRRGIDKHLKDKAGLTAHDLARRKGYQDIVELLEKEEISSELHTSEDDNEMTTSKEPFYCDLCQQQFSQSTVKEHQASTLHQFNEKPTLPSNKLNKFNISARNRGLQLMVKQGWDKESGLGPNLSGRLYPLKTVLRKERTGLGIEQQAARVTHFGAFDTRATERRKSNYYKAKPRTRNDIQREKKREWKRERRLRRELS